MSTFMRTDKRRFVPLLLLVMALIVTACGGGGTPAADDDRTGSPVADDTGEAGAGEDDGGTADAEFEFKYTTIFSPGSAIQDSMDWWLDEVEARSEGRIKFERFYGGSLLAGTDTIAGLSEARADAGYVVPAYTPGELPLLNIAMVPGAGGQDNEAHARALLWLTKNNEHVRQEVESNGVRIQNFIIIGTLDTVMTPEPITDISQFDGLTLRAIGFISEAFKMIGAEPVAIEAQEAYEAVQRGVIDGIQSLPLESIPAQGIHEVAPWITDLRFGHFGAGSLGLSQAAYDELPADLQAIIDEVSDEFYAKNAEITMEREASACETVLEAGGGVTILPDDQVEEWRNMVGDSLLEQWRADAAGAGLTEDEIAELESQFMTKAEELAAESTYQSGLVECREKSPDPADS